MDIEEFIQSEKDYMEKFYKYWVEQQKQDKEGFRYPEELNQADWEEQFLMFKERN